MLINLNHNHKQYQVNLTKPLDISIPLVEGLETVNCFYAPPMSVSPVIAGDFVGDTQKGGPVNFMNVKLNPHGNGTHTECLGHVAKERYTINQCLKEFHFIAELVSVYPERVNGDKIITKKILEQATRNHNQSKAIIIRTYPNDDLKLKTNYSGANPTYMEVEAIQYVLECGFEHLLIDLPSVDREEDGGKLAAHKTFWEYPNNPQTQRTISELIYVPNDIKDGLYFLQIQIASFEIDVSPSKIVIYQVEET